MVKIVHKKILNSSVTLLEAEAPLITRKVKTGWFIILHLNERGERIPLTIADYDREKKTAAVTFQKVGLIIELLAELNEGDFIRDFVGPLGLPTELSKGIKRVCVMGEGVDYAIAYPQARICHIEGLEVNVIASLHPKNIVIPEDGFKPACDHLCIMAGDSSCGEQGLVTVKLKELIDDGIHHDAVIAIGPTPIIRFISKTTEPYDIRAIVNLNPIMIDGTGVCGSCRVIVGSKMKFACVGDPDSDDHEISFNELTNRNSVYHARKAEEKERHACRTDQSAHELMGY